MLPDRSSPLNQGPSITHWLGLLQAGDLDAAQPLWEHYFDRLVRLASARLPPTGVADGEDVALSAFKSFCLGAAAGRFPRLSDRDDLWRLLVFITGQKVADELTRRNALKRGGGASPVEGVALEEIVGAEPTPEFAVLVAEQVQRLLDRLGDEQLRQIALWKMESYTNAEISARLGCALRTVANKLELIRKVLQSECAS
jgi:DNA-directed RNA polymerase specialized sigma24 family protein